MKKLTSLRDLFFTTRFFLCWGVLALLFLSAYFVPFMMTMAKSITLFFAVLTLLDLILLFGTKKTIRIRRLVADMLSLAEENKVRLHIESTFAMPLTARVIDELPEQFQIRDFILMQRLEAGASIETDYLLKPTTRGEYSFGNLHVFASTALKFVQRRFTVFAEKKVKVYPAFLQLRKFQIKSAPDVNASAGGHRPFRRGFSTEFDHIKEYTRGDDARTINWKASARRSQLMINSFMDEKSQQIYCLIDKGRLMKMPFDHLSLLDYAINATLMFSYVSLQKDDKIGLITFAEKVEDVLQPSKAKKQFNKVMETLYLQETRFLESNFADLYTVVNKRAGQRSLLILFTNFETLQGFERQLPYLRRLNQKHLLCVVLFENTEVSALQANREDSIEDIYLHTIADKFLYEKKMILKELQKNDILAIYTSPSSLTVNVVNKYLELKARQFI
jgi:hypothetical protein